MPFELSIFDKLNHLHHIARTTSYHLWITNVFLGSLDCEKTRDVLNTIQNNDILY